MRTYEVSCGFTAKRGRHVWHMTFHSQLVEAASAEAAPGVLLTQAMEQHHLDSCELANEPVVNEIGVSHQVSR